MQQIRRLARLHVDIPAAVIFFLLVVLIHRPLTHGIFAAVGWADRELNLPLWFSGFTQNVLSNLVAAMIAAPVVVFVLGLRKKSELVGRFDAYDVAANGTETAWGQVDLTYNIVSNRVKGVLKKDQIEIEIEAVLERPYLRGHYVECSNLVRRRLGAFLMMLDGDGAVYSGRTVFVDPDINNYVPQAGSVRWVRKN